MKIKGCAKRFTFNRLARYLLKYRKKALYELRQMSKHDINSESEEREKHYKEYLYWTSIADLFHDEIMSTPMMMYWRKKA